ncbi:MAG TPA: YHYH protein [Ilumatobacteraceae bacterium]|nr:YHYH protein [Ilumatobacteraceae bacterium]HUV19364.1 YHYH protein [Ilumatobacteraceae bacterium]
MTTTSRRVAALLVPIALTIGACGSSDDTANETSTSSEATTTSIDQTTTSEVATTSEPADESVDSDLTSLFVDGALTAEPSVVDCTLENGSETTCYQLEVASLPDTVDTDGPYCPETVDDVGGIWVWDGDEPGLYALDAEFWTMMNAQGYDFVDPDGNISITDPAAGPASSSSTANSCLEATADGSYHLRILLPTTPELLDAPTSLSTISQIGLALDGVTIFGDAPSVADRGGLPALDACGGHIDPSGYYHWHFGAESIQTNLDEAGTGLTCDVDQDVEALIGFSFDGYAIYGPEENRAIPSDLDECSGHVSDTEESGEIYHYHLTYDSPNLPACRVGASAVGTLSSPDNASVALPNGQGPGGGGRPAP